MHTIFLSYRKVLHSIIIIAVIGWSSLPVAAVSPTNPAGPPESVGIDKSKVGPQGSAGLIGSVGPQVQVGVTNPIGPQVPATSRGPRGQTAAVTSSSGSADQVKATSQPEPSSASNATSEASSQASTGLPGSQPPSGVISATPISSPVAATSAPSSSPSKTSASNNETGANSDNQSTIEHNESKQINDHNRTNLNNQITGSVGSGNNMTNANTGDGSIATGDVTGVVNVINAANSSIVAQSGAITQQTIGDSSQDIVIGDPASASVIPLSAIVLGDLAGGSTADATNDTTGAHSHNQATIRTLGDTHIRVSNDATVENDVVLAADTGNNQANQNTGIGNIVTGTINIVTNIVNFLNTFLSTDYLGLAFINIVGTFSGDIMAPGATAVNSDTGANSSNNSSIHGGDSLRLTKESDAKVNNNVVVDGQTGNNQANENTLTGSITTGDTDVEVQSATVTGDIPADSLLLVVVNQIGDGEWTGQVIGADPDKVLVVVSKSQPAHQLEASNSNTGASSENSTSITQDRDVETTQKDNALVNNSIAIHATTGNNQASQNTGGGNIKSGDINVGGGIVNFVNAAGVSLKKVVISVINVFGRWTGNLVFGQKKVTALPQPTAQSPAPTQASAALGVSNQSTTPSPMPIQQPGNLTTASTVAEVPQSLVSGDTSVAASAPPKTVQRLGTDPTITTSTLTRGAVTPGAPEKINEQIASLASQGDKAASQPIDAKPSRTAGWYYVIILVVAGAIGVALGISRKQFVKSQQ